jgi:Flp pilus assembly protein TadG
MMKKSFATSVAGNQNGVTAIVVALVLVVFVSCAAVAVDVGHLVVVKNELQNGADAGALAGARVLYNEEGTSVNPGADQVALQTAIANMSQKTAVEVTAEDVQRGHWCFATLTFTPNNALAPVDLWNSTTAALDANPDFINAVKVTAKRFSTPVVSFFARIFGRDSFTMEADAVAYIGFAGTLNPHELDQPIVICDDSLRIDGDIYTCTVGRMINSGSNISTSQTGGWTNLIQESVCTGGTNANEMRSLICSTGNLESLKYGNDIGTSGGMIDSVFSDLEACWRTKSNNGTEPWSVTLPVGKCEGNNLTTCVSLAGAVEVNFLWINAKNVPSLKVPGDDWPVTMSGVAGYPDWTALNPESLEESWASFVENFNLKAPDGVSPAELLNKCIFFLPDCTPHAPAGTSGGENFGVLAKIPVLVE